MAMAWPKQADLDTFKFKEEATKTAMGYFFGYREWDRRKVAGMPVNLEFPFGHGLSYTTFEYLGGAVPCSDVKGTTIIDVTVDVRNTGMKDGEEVIMLFVKPPAKPAGVTGDRPVRELKGFYKVALKAGEGKRVTIPLKIQDLRRWEGAETGKWVIDPGMYTVLAGPNNDDANLKPIGTFTYTGT
jgi:beta-glucosidase